jgi:hypothetical protein
MNGSIEMALFVVKEVMLNLRRIMMWLHNLPKKDRVGLWKDVFKWKGGRQRSGYRTFLLFFNPFFIPFHVLLLHYPAWSYTPFHVDPVPGKRHYRFNLSFWLPKIGGTPLIVKPYINTRRIQFFRSDLCPHSVSTVYEGTRWVLSIGWVLKE